MENSGVGLSFAEGCQVHDRFIRTLDSHILEVSSCQLAATFFPYAHSFSSQIACQF